MPSDKGGKLIKGYMLKSIKTGLYLKRISVGGIFWSKKGRIFSAKGYIASSINSVLYSCRRISNAALENEIIDGIGDWEIVELSETSSYPLAFIADKIKLE